MSIIGWMKERRRIAAERAEEGRRVADEVRRVTEARASLQTKIIAAIKEKKFDVAEQLLSSTSDRTILDGKESPLLDESLLCDATAVRWLVQHGASPNASNAKGATPLHIVASGLFCVWCGVTGRNPVEALCILLGAGADAHAKDAAGKTPLDVLHAAPGGIGLAISAATVYSQGTTDTKTTVVSSLMGTLPTVQTMQLILEACATSPAPKKLAAEAILKPTKATIAFIMISPIVRVIMESLRQKYPDTPLPEVIRESLDAMGFACAKCGPLNRDLFELAVSAKWVQEMNPDVTPIFAGPRVAAVFTGWCPQCLSTSVDMSFDPGRLSFVSRHTLPPRRAE